MHLLMILIGFSVAWALRYPAYTPAQSWAERWQRSLSQFLLAPLFLLMTTISVVWMGPHGWMVWRWEGWLSYWLAIGCLLGAIGVAVFLAWQGAQTLNQIRTYPLITLGSQAARLLPTPELYSAQIGFWQPDLVVSQGLLKQLDEEHLAAVLVHEQAHARHHDTFWFFWLGWVRRLTFWLPQTESLWQELLTLRELRADREAAETVDPLLLAESLLTVVSAPLRQTELCAPFGAAEPDRLTERIDALLSPGKALSPAPSWRWLGFLWVLLPLLFIPLHAV